MSETTPGLLDPGTPLERARAIQAELQRLQTTRDEALAEAETTTAGAQDVALMRAANARAIMGAYSLDLARQLIEQLERPQTAGAFYDAVVAVIDQVKTADRPEDTDAYAARIAKAAETLLAASSPRPAGDPLRAVRESLIGLRTLATDAPATISRGVDLWPDVVAQVDAIQDHLTAAAGGTPLRVLTVLHVRDPDGPCNLTLWQNGREYPGPWGEDDIDAGRGHDAEEWDRRLAEAEALPPSPYRDELVTLLADPPGVEHIHGWSDYVRPTPARDDDYTPAAIDRTQES